VDAPLWCVVRMRVYLDNPNVCVSLLNKLATLCIVPYITQGWQWHSETHDIFLRVKPAEMYFMQCSSSVKNILLCTCMPMYIRQWWKKCTLSRLKRSKHSIWHFFLKSVLKTVRHPQHFHKCSHLVKERWDKKRENWQTMPPTKLTLVQGIPRN